jgi:5-methylcytosine-specific restriction protein A
MRRKAEIDKRRPSARQRGYDTKWDKERVAFLKMHPTCARCSSPAKVVDHIIPHRGDKGLFWSRSNWQPLCTRHHSGAKQSEERRAK